MNHNHIAEALYQAEQDRSQIATLTTEYPEMTVEDAYQIQLINAARRLAEGQKLIGLKIGLTSRGMQELLGVSEPDYGHLFADMLIPEGEACSMSGLIQPRVEGELTFCLNKTLRGPGVTVEDVMQATEYVIPSIEIVDSRILDWKIKLEDTVADNGSSARLILGGKKLPADQVDMRLTGMTLEKNGQLVNSGTAAEVWGNPAAAVAWLANKLAAYNIDLPAGSLIMSGALTAAQFAKAGDTFTASFHGMGSATVTFTE